MAFGWVSFSLLAFALSTALAYVRKQRWYRRTKGFPLPPRRKGLPILGNALDILKGLQWETYLQWGKELGSDFFYLDAAGTSIVVLNSVQANVDLLDKKSTISSDRFHSVMVEDLMGWGWIIPLLPYGEDWRIRRRLFQKHFHPLNDKLYKARVAQYLREMLARLHTSPASFREHTRLFLAGAMFSLAYGVHIDTTDHHYLRLAEEAMNPTIEAAVPGTFLVDIIPAMKHIPAWIPGADFQRKASLWRELGQRLRNQPFYDAVQKINTGTRVQSFVSMAMNNKDEAELTVEHETIVKDCAGIFFIAGSETTTDYLDYFFLAMICFPDVQRKAQQELDQLLEGQRLPDYDDAEKLPYVSALVKEVLRWEPVLPIGIPHASTEDHIYRGCFIPKGTLIIPNFWAMMRDEKYYPQPEAFRPERFLSPNGALDPNVQDPEDLIFGFGRRICPGSHIAISTLFLTFASVLSLFSISKPLDEDGNEIEPSMQHRFGLARSSAPFACSIAPRSKEAEILISSLSLQEAE